MSDPNEKIKNATRRHRDEIAMQRQVKIAKSNHYGHDDAIIKEPHRLVKHHAMNCGNPGCMLCGNPRKIFGELTTQEKRFYQDTDAVRERHSNGINIADDGDSTT